MLTDSKVHSCRLYGTSLFFKKSQEAEAQRAIGFEMYYCSCGSFSWNNKLCTTSERPGPRFANSESQTSLKLLIYLPVSSQVFLHPPHVEQTLRVMVLLKARWFPSLYWPVSPIAKLGLNEIRDDEGTY